MKLFGTRTTIGTKTYLEFTFFGSIIFMEHSFIIQEKFFFGFRVKHTKELLTVKQMKSNHFH